MIRRHPREFAAAAAALAVLVAIAVWWSRLPGDLWPPDRSFVGPNLVAAVLQAAVVTVAVALVYPPFRRAIHRFVDAKLAKHHEHHEWQARQTQKIADALGVELDDHPQFDLKH